MHEMNEWREADFSVTKETAECRILQRSISLVAGGGPGAHLTGYYQRLAVVW